MSKTRILVAPGDKAGSGKFRCVDPHVNLQKNYPDDFFVDINYEIDFNNEEYLKNYDVVFIHRIPQHRVTEAVDIIKRIKNLGIKVVIDTDDYWHLDFSHGMHHAARMQKIPEIMLECIKLADLVTVPTKILADALLHLNRNIAILPNAIDPTEEQFRPNPTKSDLIRFGWLGGSSHIKDINLLQGMGSSQNSIGENTQYVLCGFDTRGVVRMQNPKTGETQERPMRPEETTWFMYELFLTNSYRNIADDKEYMAYLTTFTENPNFNDLNKKYRRIWTKSINQYAKGYNHFDVALAPLDDTKFNLYKSQLKIIEAGFHKKALIAQNYGPYTIDLIDGKNALLVDTKKNHKQWVKHAKKLVQNPELIKELGENLYNTVKDKYDLNNVSKHRYQAYKSLIK